uniref:Nucleoprotein n=1 Tax=Niwlog virus TaxID=2800933 RepID=A0A894KDJ6_9VIRU|nr:MAG: nucleoprotein [Niwlog virus]
MTQQVASMATVRQIIERISGLLDANDWATTLQNIVTRYEYQGLNVLQVVQSIYASGARRGRTPAIIDGNIVEMVCLFLTRGNNLRKMVERSSEAGATSINDLRVTYGLVERARGAANGITLSRVAASFPIITLRILANPDVIIPRAVTLPAAFGQNFPRQMQTVIAASIFPSGDNGKTLMKALLLYMIEENKVIGEQRNANPQDVLTRIIPFAKASYVSSIIPAGDRVDACTTVDLIVAGAVAGSVTPAALNFEASYPGTNLSFMD